jgi:hypothetical protein
MGRSLGLLDFGEADWSEENGSRGATLVSVQRRPGLELTVRNLALHEHPAFLRTMSILNTSDDAVTVLELWPEWLPIVRDGVRVYTEDFSSGAASADWVASEPGAAVALQDRGLFFGQRRGGRFGLMSGDEGECSVRVAGPRTLGPGEVWELEPTFLVPFTGRVVDAAATVYSQFLAGYLEGEE